MASKPDMKSMADEFIANESEMIIDAVSSQINQPPSTGSSVETKEKEIEENSAGTNSHDRSSAKAANIIIPNKKEYDVSIDERLPETVTLLTTPDGGKLYLVGTAHFSLDSQNDVSMIIQAVQPDVVAFELCRDRVCVLELDEEVMFRYTKKLTFSSAVQTLKEYGTHQGFFHILLLRMIATFAQQLEMAPGGEFRRGYEEAKKIPNCIIQLADRPINITLQRAIRSLTWWQTLKIGWNLISLEDCQISREEVEIYKKKDSVDDLISSLKEKFPTIEKVFVEERDLYLTHSLQIACMPQWTSNGAIPTRAVGIVGMGHIPGIIKNWGKVKPSDITPIMSVPPQALSTKIIKLTVKVSLLSAAFYAGYKVILLPFGITAQSVRSWMEGLLKVSDIK